MLDIFVCVVFLWSFISGWRNGLVKEVASSVGLFLGLLIAINFYDEFGEYLSYQGTFWGQFGSIFAFIILCVAVPIVLGGLAAILTKMLNWMYLGAFNSLLGAVVSMMKYLVLIVFLLITMETLGILDKEGVAHSMLQSPVRKAMSFLKTLGNEVVDME